MGILYPAPSGSGETDVSTQGGIAPIFRNLVFRYLANLNQEQLDPKRADGV